MPEAESKGFNLPWAPLLALVAAIAGLSALLPSHSARPPAAGTEVSLPRHKGISARLWQDPLQVVIEAEAHRVKDSKDPGGGKPGWTELETEYGELKLNTRSPLVLIVCVPDSPYAEDAERRLRDRSAVLQALSAENYVPRHSKVLKYVLSDDCAFPDYPLPFESFGPFDNALAPHQAPDARRRNILVVWVGDGYLGGQPLHGLARIAGHFFDHKQPDPLPELRILGPSTSGQYREMLEELGQPMERDFELTKFLLSHHLLLFPSPESLLSQKPILPTDFLLSHAQLFSCKATGADSILREGITWLEHDGASNTARAVQKRMRTNINGFACLRTTHTDDEFCRRLWEELEQRHISNAHIAVLSELDSFYGRASVDTFVTSRPVHGTNRANGSSNVHAYYYMAGIDGALPKNALGAEEKIAKDQSSGEKAPIPQQEATEGHSQVDYFRRLADSLAQENQRLIASAKPGQDGNIDRDGFKAVVVLGSDIYDKLQILRTLRPRLSTALFLTDGLDARFGHPDEWDETRNLIVAAGQPLRLDLKVKGNSPPPFDNSPLPFRDSIQTSVYLAARHALHTTDKIAMADYPLGWQGPVRLFEIGKRGPAPLGEDDEKNHWGHQRWLSLIRAIGVMIVMLCLIVGRNALPPGASLPTDPWQRLYLRMSQAPLAVPAALLLSGYITLLRYFSQDPSTAEPFALYDGISIWPGDFVRTFVFLLAIHFVCKILFTLDASSQSLARDFGAPKPPSLPPIWKRIYNFFAKPGLHKRFIKLWQSIVPPAARPASGALANVRHVLTQMLQRIIDLWPHVTLAPGAPVNARPLLARYYRWTTPGKRCLRASVYCILYVSLVFAIASAFPSPNPDLPVRGPAHDLSMVILFAAVVAMLFVTFLVVDSTTVNCLFIRELNSDRTNWRLPNRLPRQSHFKYPNHFRNLDKEDCADFLDIQYIARKSDVVNRLIYFPFILVALLLIARSPTTDGYAWSPMLVFVFVLNISWAVYCAIRLPIEACAARSDTLQRLRSKLFRRRAEEAAKMAPPHKSNAAALDAVITEIENLRQGAFLGIWEQPLLRAFLVPSGGVGLSALLNLIPH